MAMLIILAPMPWRRACSATIVSMMKAWVAPSHGTLTKPTRVVTSPVLMPHPRPGRPIHGDAGLSCDHAHPRQSHDAVSCSIRAAVRGNSHK